MAYRVNGQVLINDQGQVLQANNIGLIRKPINATPANNATGVSVTPVLTASAYESLYGNNTHQFSLFQVSQDITFDAVDYSSGIVTANVSHTVTTPLSLNTFYYWRVRYTDDVDNNVSDFSEVTNFTTTAIP